MTVIYVGDKKVGEFMKKKVFEPGRTLTGDGLTKFATGEELIAEGVRGGLRGRQTIGPMGRIRPLRSCRGYRSSHMK